MSNRVFDIRERRGYKTLRDGIDLALKEHPDARHGIIVAFDSDGCMQIYFGANSQQLAMAAARLLHLAGED